MNMDEFKQLRDTRKAAYSIGLALHNKLEEDAKRQIVIALLDEISNYAAPIPNRLQLEVAFGIIDALTPETADELRSRLIKYVI